MQQCRLCKSDSDLFYTIKGNNYLLCPTCEGIFVENNNLPDRELEVARYKAHNNDVNDAGYRNFVKPIVNEILNYQYQSEIGLDYGAGPGPVVSQMLIERNYTIKQYDPFFYNYPELLNQQYNYIVCCEVMEHFHKPAVEFFTLKNLLLKGGKLYCKTNIYNASIDFRNWYYKNDITHVFFYQEKTLQFIRSEFKFSNVQIRNDVIIFSC